MNTKKKLLFIIDQYKIGGPQKSLLALLENIDFELFDVTVMAIKEEGVLKKYLPSKVKTVVCPPLIRACLMPSCNTKDSLIYLLKSFEFGIFLDFIANIIKSVYLSKNMNVLRQKTWIKYRKKLQYVSGEYDAAFAYTAGLTTYVVVDSVKAKKKYYWIRNDYRITGMDKEIECDYFKKMSGYLSVSPTCSSIFENEFPFTKGRIDVVYNFIPTEFYKKVEESVVSDLGIGYARIITVSRIDKLKGIEFVIEAAESLKKQGINFRWFILGDGGARKEYERICIEKDLSEIVFLGFKLNSLQYLRQCDIMVHPSRTEGKSNAVDEAKYSGVPVIATRYDTVDDQIINRETGIICGFSGDEIALHILELLENTELREHLIKNISGKIDANKDSTNNLLFSLS